MAVNTVQLQSELSAHGTIVFCDEHNPYYYLVVMEGVIDHDTVHNIIDSYVAIDYPNQVSCTLVDGVLKCEKSK